MRRGLAFLTLDQNQEIATISAQLIQTASKFTINGQSYGHKDLGFLRLEVEDHHSGCHTPEGSLIIYNSRTSKAAKPAVNYLEYAPALLKHFGIAPRPYMGEPSFTI